MVDAIIAADDPVARNFTIDETLYDPQGEIGQPLKEFNEQDMAADFEATRISGEASQIIIDAIAEANAVHY